MPGESETISAYLVLISSMTLPLTSPCFGTDFKEHAFRPGITVQLYKAYPGQVAERKYLVELLAYAKGRIAAQRTFPIKFPL